MTKNHPWFLFVLLANVVILAFIVNIFLINRIERKIDNFPYKKFASFSPVENQTESFPQTETAIEEKNGAEISKIQPNEKRISVKPRTLGNRLFLEDLVSLNINRDDMDNNEFYGYGGVINAEVLASETKPNGFLRLNYDVSSPSSYAGFEADLKNLDLTGFKKLVFKLLRETGNEVFFIRLSDGKNMDKVSIKQFFSGDFSKGWQQVIIPLEKFKLIRNWENMNGVIGFVFENSQGTPYSGSINIKDVAFER
jgi:hypothetical protein